MILQSIAMAFVGLALLAALWWLGTSRAGASPGTIASAALVVPVSAGILVAGWTGLRRWLAGGPPTRLYGFDALPLVYLLATAGPNALQDPIGLGIVVVFTLPGLATFLATGRRA